MGHQGSSEMALPGYSVDDDQVCKAVGKRIFLSSWEESSALTQFRRTQFRRTQHRTLDVRNRCRWPLRARAPTSSSLSSANSRCLGTKRSIAPADLELGQVDQPHLLPRIAHDMAFVEAEARIAEYARKCTCMPAHVCTRMGVYAYTCLHTRSRVILDAYRYSHENVYAHVCAQVTRGKAKTKTHPPYTCLYTSL